MAPRDIFQPLTVEDATRSYVWSLVRKSDRLAFSPATRTFVAPGPYATPTAAAATPPANSDCYMPMVRLPDGLKANMLGQAAGVPRPAQGDGYLSVILDADTGETHQGLTQLGTGTPFDVEVSFAFS